MESILESWIRDCDTDHARIEAIIARLRSDFVLDPSAPADESAASPVEGFLKSKRGPAYLFATTAACLFRSIGLESRVATGFYIDGDDFDRESSHYAATSDSYHWWVQIQLTDGSWLSLEPTPGYDPPLEHWSWRERLAWGTAWVFQTIRRHPIVSLLVLVLTTLGYACRIVLADAVYTLAYRLAVNSPKSNVWVGRCGSWKSGPL